VIGCAVSFCRTKGVVRAGENPAIGRDAYQTLWCQAMTHPPPEVPPPVSNSTGKSCCSPEVDSEGAKKEKKESI